MRRLQYSIRTLMIIAALLAVGLGVFLVPDWTRAYYANRINQCDYNWLRSAFDPNWSETTRIAEAEVTTGPGTTLYDFLDLKRTIKVRVRLAKSEDDATAQVHVYRIQFNKIWLDGIQFTDINFRPDNVIPIRQ